MHKFNLIINDTASVFATDQDMKNGIGDLIVFNNAVRDCLYYFEDTYKEDPDTISVSGTWNKFHLELIKLKWN